MPKHSTFSAGAIRRQAEIARLRARNAELRAALETIHAGDTMAGRDSWAHADVLQEHYKICRAALAKSSA